MQRILGSGRYPETRSAPLECGPAPAARFRESPRSPGPWLCPEALSALLPSLDLAAADTASVPAPRLTVRDSGVVADADTLFQILIAEPRILVSETRERNQPETVIDIEVAARPCEAEDQTTLTRERTERCSLAEDRNVVHTAWPRHLSAGQAVLLGSSMGLQTIGGEAGLAQGVVSERLPAGCCACRDALPTCVLGSGFLAEWFPLGRTQRQPERLVGRLCRVQAELGLAFPENADLGRVGSVCYLSAQV
ncbi:hypothetical protein H920_09056 [Fukomys damarensis]|uniref:Uncharacterized protein n=1 Tax=Fukomys damarensis TaxID=885580 RepID=A0A091DBD4_FUKDA|nr:hypothetical protein H920_09056 [Fukomys damarensis]